MECCLSPFCLAPNRETTRPIKHSLGNPFARGFAHGRSERPQDAARCRAVHFVVALAYCRYGKDDRLVTLQVKVAKAVHADSKKDEDGDGKGKQ